VTENIWSHSGIQQGTETHNVLRFETPTPIARQCHAPQNERVVHQCVPTVSTMIVTPGADGALRVDADLTGAYAKDSAVKQWTRRLDFSAAGLRVEDRFRTTPGTRAIFQLQLPGEPRIEGREAVAGGLRIRVISPADAQLSTLDWRTVNRDEFRSGWRLDIAGSGDTYVVELLPAAR
jgi:hypothetical protein